MIAQLIRAGKAARVTPGDNASIPAASARVKACAVHTVGCFAPAGASFGADWCTDCGAYLGLLKRQPQRIAYCVAGSVALGAGLFYALAWQVFAPVFRGSIAAEPGAWFWWGFGSATFFLALGLTARSHLASALQRVLGSL